MTEKIKKRRTEDDRQVQYVEPPSTNEGKDKWKTGGVEGENKDGKGPDVDDLHGACAQECGS